MIVAFGHKKRRGKDTAAKFLDTFLRCESGLRIKRAAFADKLKDISFQLYSWSGLQPGVYYETHPEVKEQILPAIGLSPREIWIEVGNSLREVYPYTWIDFVIKQVKADIVICSDLRFWNEAVSLREQGAVMIKIDRPGPMATDPAEVDLDTWTDWDYTIFNEGSLEDLNTQVTRIGLDLIDKVRLNG